MEKPDSRVAVVTGAAGIIGPSICKELQNAGWRVAACDVDQASFREIESYAQKVPCTVEFYADLSSASACSALIHQVEEQLGPVQLLVNNAVYDGPSASLDEIGSDTFAKVMQMNLGAPLFLTQAALPSLTRSRGSVIMMSSVLTRTFRKNSILYAASKAALEKTTETLAFELSDKGVRVNCIRVGYVPGAAFIRPLLRKLPPHQARQLYDYVMPLHNSGHIPPTHPPFRGHPQHIASVVRFLASDEAEYLHGAILPADGGFWFRTSNLDGSPMKKSYELVRNWLRNNGLEYLEEEVQ